MDEVYVIMSESHYKALTDKIKQLESQLGILIRNLQVKEDLNCQNCSGIREMKLVEVEIPDPAQASLIELSDEIIAIRYGLTKNKCHERTELGNVKQIERNIKICEPSILDRSPKYNDGLMCPNVAGIVRSKGKPEFK